MRYLIFTLMGFISITAWAQPARQSASTMYPLMGVKEVTMPSKFSKRIYKIQITFTGDSIDYTRHYPVLYYSDAWEVTEMATLFGKSLTGYREAIPFFLVGISFDADVNTFLKLREQDFRPDINPGPNNGAIQFLRFIKEQLIPYMEKNYPADQNDRGYYGYSYGALFGAWALSKEPELFHKMALGSIAGGEFLLNDSNYVSSLRQLAGLTVFSSYGTEEKLADANLQFQQLLQSNTRLNTECLRFQGDTHVTAWPMALMRGLKFLYQQ